MNPPPGHPDPLLNSLADEARDLPALAASEARRFRARRTRSRRHWTCGLAIAILGLCCWPAVRLLRSSGGDSAAPSISARRAPALPTALPTAFVKVETLHEAMSEPLPAPPGATGDQRALIEAARGLPLLLVMDPSGKLARIHVLDK